MGKGKSMREKTFHKLIHEFDLVIAMRVLEFGVILRTTKAKIGDFSNDNAFLNRCKERFTKRISHSGDDVDKIADILFATIDFEMKEDMAGLGGCTVPRTISEMINQS